MIRAPLWQDVLFELEDAARTSCLDEDMQEREAVAYGIGFEAALRFLWANPEAAFEAARQQHFYDYELPIGDAQGVEVWEAMAEKVIADRENWGAGIDPPKWEEEL